MNKNGFDEATVEVHLYSNEKITDKLIDFDATTYNIENGKVVVTKVDKNSLFKDKDDKEIVQKFTFPNIKEGSIVEYDYKVSSPAYWSIDSWHFQQGYPRLWSEYSVEIPQFYNFITLKQGYLPYTIDSANMMMRSYTISDPGKDTIWLECTNQTDPADYMGSFTGNRKALLISDDGGHVVNTPYYTANDNTQTRVINAIIDETGKLNANVNTHYTGIEQESVGNMLNYKTKKEQTEILKKDFDLSTYDITDFNYQKTKTKIPVINEQLKLVADNYAGVSGKRLFVKPNILCCGCFAQPWKNILNAPSMCFLM